MTDLESTVAGFYKSEAEDMPEFKFTGATIAMCAYYNKDQVHNRAGYY